MLKIINFSYKNILHNINIEFNAQYTLLIGPSGSGKTTLLKSLLGLVKGTGTVLLKGKELKKPGPHRKMSCIWQEPRLIPDLTVKENLVYFTKYNDSIVRDLEIDFLDKKPYMLSGGEAQRVNIARGLMTNSEYLLLDEPLQNIDGYLTNRIVEYIFKYSNNRKLIYVTHEFQQVLNYTKNVVLINKGHCIAQGNLESLYYEPPSKWVAKFLGQYYIIPYNFYGNILIFTRPESFSIERGEVKNAKILEINWNKDFYKIKVIVNNSIELSIHSSLNQSFRVGDSVYVKISNFSTPVWLTSNSRLS